MENFFVWEKKYETAIPEIDEQHKKLVELINTLYNAFYSSKTKDHLTSILDELKNYTIYHFNTEENYFKKFHFELAKEHTAVHEEFKKKIAEFVDQFVKGHDVTFRLMGFLRRWLGSHILEEDRKYIELFKKNF